MTTIDEGPREHAVTVERARPDDWRAVRQLRLASLLGAPEAYCATHEAEVGLDEAAWRARLDQPGTTTLVARVDGAPAGLVMVQRWEERSVAGIAGVWVEPSARGRGVGDALLRAAIDTARDDGWGRVALEVGDHNRAAQELYARHGFAPTGRVSTMPPPKEHVTEHELARDL